MKLLLGFFALVAVAHSKYTSQDQETFLELTSQYNESSLLADNEDAKLSVPELIEKYGYPVETHDIITADGYILQAHRIPYGKKCGPGERKRVVWLQHGLLGDSANWIIVGPEKGLAYNLADNCYDVWMGNYRGNTYSRRHVSLDPDKDKEAFWSFSWNEIGLYDIPADIDYVLNVTGVDGIYYVGHSMGTTAFWVCMSERPEYNSKIKLMSAYAPVSFTEHMITPLSVLANYEGTIEDILSMLGVYEFLPTSKFMELLGQTACHQISPIKEICSNVLFLIAGYNSEQLDRDLLPTLLGHMPAGSSVRNLIHYAQGVENQKFRKYDYGRRKNLEIYGSPDPPDYQVERITAPVAFYWGQNDWLGVVADTYRLAERLPNLVRMYRINHDRYNHLDFLIAKDNVELINKQTIEFMKNF